MEQAAPFLIFKSPQARFFKAWEEAVGREGQVMVAQEYQEAKEGYNKALISFESKQITNEYLAGVFDACGEVRIEEGGSLRIRILSPNAFFAEVLRQRFGGSTEEMRPKDQQTRTGVVIRKRKIFHRWTVSGREATTFLKMIYPSLWLRREMVEGLFLEI